MNGTDMKKAAINKAKQVAQAANGKGGKKRRKGQDLKPIITTEQQKSQDASPASANTFQYKYVNHSFHCTSSLLCAVIHPFTLQMTALISLSILTLFGLR